MSFTNEKEARDQVWDLHRSQLKRDLDAIPFTTTQRNRIDTELYALEALFNAANNATVKEA